MGMFDDDSDAEEQNNRVQAQLNEEMETNKRTLEQKRQAIVAQRLAIIKSQGGQIWTPGVGTPGYTSNQMQVGVQPRNKAASKSVQGKMNNIADMINGGG